MRTDFPGAFQESKPEPPTPTHRLTQIPPANHYPLKEEPSDRTSENVIVKLHSSIPTELYIGSTGMSAMTSNSVFNGKLPPRDGNIRNNAELQGHLIHRNARWAHAA